MKRLLTLAAAVLLASAVTAGEFPDISVNDLQKAIDAKKVTVIDVNGSDPTVILGSYNWTDSGAYDNDENTLIIHDAALAQAYYAEWQRMWSALDSNRLCVRYLTYVPLVTTSGGP